MSREDRDYYNRRAEQELERACMAADPDAARVHLLLARLYLDKLDADIVMALADA